MSKETEQQKAFRATFTTFAQKVRKAEDFVLSNTCSELEKHGMYQKILLDLRTKDDLVSAFASFV